MGETIVTLERVSKRYGGVDALSDLTLNISRGTVHALVGENGAGKSTAGKIIGGVARPDEGSVYVDGRPVRYHSPHDALRDGIAFIAQELALVPARTVLDNVFLGHEPHSVGIVDKRALRREYERLTERVGIHVPAGTHAGRLRIADMQKVEILRALARDARVIVMDEPTAALSAPEVAQLKQTIRTLKGSGTTIIYISHFLEEVLDLADDVTTLRNGRLVRTSPASDETPETLITAMLGASLSSAYPPKTPPPADAPVLLRVDGLTRHGVLNDISFELRAGEILGIAGLVGSGRTELARCLFGADPIDAGTVTLDGKRVRVSSPRRAMDLGLALIPESRKDQGLVMNRGVLENVSLPHLSRSSRFGIIDRKAERRWVSAALRAIKAPADREQAPVASLSGGNQQKILFARWLYGKMQVLLADEPTRGVDIGAKRSIYELLNEFARNRAGILFISSDIEEIIGLAHRVLVMRQGSIVASFDNDEIAEAAIMHAAFGGAPPATAAA